MEGETDMNTHPAPDDVECVRLVVSDEPPAIGTTVNGTHVVVATLPVILRPTDMSFNGHQLFSIIHDRDGPETDNEFAERHGFDDGFMDMVGHHRVEGPTQAWSVALSETG